MDIRGAMIKDISRSWNPGRLCKFLEAGCKAIHSQDLPLLMSRSTDDNMCTYARDLLYFVNIIYHLIQKVPGFMIGYKVRRKSKY